MNKEKDFFKTCFNTVASLEVKNESQAIAREVILNEVEKLQQESEQLKKQYCERTDCGGRIGNSKKVEELKKENKQLKDNWNKLKEYIRETKLKEFEKSFGKRYAKTFTQAEIIVCNMIIYKMQELEQGSDNDE